MLDKDGNERLCANCKLYDWIEKGCPYNHTIVPYNVCCDKWEDSGRCRYEVVEVIENNVGYRCNHPDRDKNIRDKYEWCAFPCGTFLLIESCRLLRSDK